ncbi:MAG: SBBP repeat-containing protein [Nostoc sp.]|uniref:SBBP repeat-containing protein n=1 Tax=Nostoc sp. TaxID=1180 RepID=UPI002FF7BF8A
MIGPALAARAVDLSSFTSFGTEGIGNGQFRYPNGVAVDPSGNIYVADTINDRIVRFNPSDFNGTFTSFGTYVRAFLIVYKTILCFK